MSYIGNQPTQVAFLTDSFSGTGSTTVFTMSVAPANTASVLVAVSGVLQDPSTYSVSGLTLTFSAAPPSGTGNISARYLGIPASGVTTTAYRTITEFTATANQKTFTPPSYTVGFINVYRNGVLLGSADYTASNGTTVVLTTGATAGDLVTVESFLVSSVLNAIPAIAGSVQQSYIAPNVAGTGPAFSYIADGTQVVAGGTVTKLLFPTKQFDTGNLVSSSKFTPNISGYYQINSVFNMTTGNTGICLVAIYKNGSEYKRGSQEQATGVYAVNVSGLVYMNGSTDYIEIYCYSGGVSTAANLSYFDGAMVRAA